MNYTVGKSCRGYNFHIYLAIHFVRNFFLARQDIDHNFHRRPKIMTSPSTEIEAILADARNKFGFEPNVIREMAKSPVAARLYLKAQDFLAEGTLTPREQHAVQLAIATANECHYCTAAHTAGGKMAGCEVDDMQTIRNGGVPADTGLATVVNAARMVHAKQGWLDENELMELEQLGIDRPRLYEIIVLIALKTITNYINHIAGTVVDDEFK